MGSDQSSFITKQQAHNLSINDKLYNKVWFHFGHDDQAQFHMRNSHTLRAV